MRKILVFLFFILFSILLFSVKSQNTEMVDTEREDTVFTWTPIIEAISQVESSGNPNAVSKDGTCVGLLQIQKIVVDDCNQYLKIKKSKKRYQYADRYNREKSIEMFLLYQERYNPTNDVEKGVRIWNGGPNGFKIKSTIQYYNRVLKKMKTRD